jgi:hypothetical protein
LDQHSGPRIEPRTGIRGACGSQNRSVRHRKQPVSGSPAKTRRLFDLGTIFFGRFMMNPSGIIARTAEIGVRSFGPGLSLFDLQPVHPGLQDVAHAAVRDKIEGQSPPTGCLKPLLAVTCPQPHQPQRGPIPLFGMGASGDDPADHLRCKQSRARSAHRMNRSGFHSRYAR